MSIIISGIVKIGQITLQIAKVLKFTSKHEYYVLY